MAITFPYKSFITREDIQEEAGFNMIDRLNDDDSPNPEAKADLFLREVARSIYDLISEAKGTEFASSVHTLAETDSEVLNLMKLAQFHQAVYLLDNGDLSAFNGLNTKGTNVNLEDLRGRRNYSPTTINVLSAAGFLYTGVR